MGRRKVTVASLLLVSFTVLLFGQVSSSSRTFPIKIAGLAPTSSGVLSGSNTIGPTTLFTPTAAGLYRLGTNVENSTAGSGGTFQVCMTTNNGTAAVVSCGASTNFNATVGTGESSINSLVKIVGANQAIIWQLNYTSAAGSPVLLYSYSLERLQ